MENGQDSGEHCYAPRASLQQIYSKHGTKYRNRIDRKGSFDASMGQDLVLVQIVAEYPTFRAH